MTFISRRDVLKRIGMTSVAVPLIDRTGGAAALHELTASIQGRDRPALQHFTQAEGQLMDAIVARLIPTDDLGPGATEAHAVIYIDRALGGALASSRPAYASGLAALDRYARSSRGAPFTQLSAVDQDSLLIDVETGTATGFTGSSAAFFGMVLNHTHQGTFGDPYYGGNANFIGWDLIQYPGVRTMVTAADQKTLESRQLKPNHRSAYDYDTFHKAQE
jgi:gluconate 2-dehydrogenase gamma chain